jgi:hypothetical protein
MALYINNRTSETVNLSLLILDRRSALEKGGVVGYEGRSDDESRSRVR